MLTLLNLKGCKNLKSLPSKFEMKSLKILILSDCSKVKRIPEFGKNMELVSEIYLDGTAITELPSTIEYLTCLASLKLMNCKNLISLPSTFFNIKSLKNLDLVGCSKLKFPDNLGTIENLEKFDVIGAAITPMSSSKSELINLLPLCTYKSLSFFLIQVLLVAALSFSISVHIY